MNKILVRIIDGSISDRKLSPELTDKVLAGTSVIDQSCFNGTQKKHLLIATIQ